MWKHLLPRSWRETVIHDLEDEARRRRRGSLWVIGHLLLIAARLGTTVNGEAMLTDARYALRSLWRSKSFAVGAMLTFALGIGVNIAVFSAIDRMMLRPLPYGHPDQLVSLGSFDASGDGPYGTVRAAYVSALRDHHPGVQSLAVVGEGLTYAATAEGPQTLGLAQASYGILEVLDVRPQLGRAFGLDDARAGQIGAVLTHEAWQSHFGGRPDILDAHVWRGRTSVPIIGVLPPGFFVPASQWVGDADGLVLDPDELRVPSSATALSTPPVVRLRDGVSLAAAESYLPGVIAASGQPVTDGTVLRMTSLRTAMFGRHVPYAGLVLLAAALVLLMCCANITGLMFVRARTRQAYVRLAMALGASRSRVIRIAVLEGLVLALSGSAVALIALAWTNAALQTRLPEIFQRYAAPPNDPRVLGFATFVAVACALAAGVWPVLRTTGRAAAGLRSATGRSEVGSGRGGEVVLAAEALIAMVLVCAAAATGTNLVRLTTRDLGFRPEGLYTLVVTPAGTLPPDSDGRYRLQMAMLDALKVVPGLAHVAAADYLPYSGARAARFLPGQLDSQTWRVSPGYFETQGTRLMAGREFTDNDVAAGNTAAVLNVEGVTRLWPDVPVEAAIGRVLSLDGLPAATIVGVVENTRSSPRAAEEAALYLPLSADGFRRMSIIVRSEGGRAIPIRDVERHLKAVGLATGARAVPVAQRMATAVNDDRFRAELFGAFGLVALALAGVGLYAVTAYEVKARQREVGLRVALGATAGDIHRMTVGRALRPVLLGAGGGLLLAWWAGSFLQSFLHQVDARDPARLALSAVSLVVAGLLASWLPAREASRVDPVTVLRSE